MKSIVRGLLLIFVVFVCTTCNKTKSNLTFSVNPNIVYLIDTNKISCSDAEAGETANPPTPPTPPGSLTPYYFFFSNFSVGWSNTTDPLYIAFVQINLTDPLDSSFSYSCTVSNSDISYMLNIPENTTLSANATPYTPTGPSVSDPGFTCNMACGGITPDSTTQNTTYNGTAVIVGYDQHSDGTQTPVQAEAYFSAVFQSIP